MSEVSEHVKELTGRSRYVCLIVPIISIKYYQRKLQESIDFLDKSEEVDFKLSERDNGYVQIEIAMKGNKDYTTDWDVLLERIKDKTSLEKENEEIKQTIKEAYNTERTSLGKSVLKQLLNNIEGLE